MPDYQGQGMAKVLLDQAEQVAIETGLFYSGLISLSSAVDYWQSKGYDLVKLSDKLLIEKILMYGTDACYMIKKLSNLFSD